jgi:hypothetical protein
MHSIDARAQSFLVAAMAVLLSLLTSPGRADSPFDSLRGSWSGGGTVILAAGGQERVRCVASYQPSGPSVRMTLRCASDSYKVDLTSQITSKSGQLSGTWSEASHQLQGDITGRSTPGVIQASAKSPTFEAAVNVRTTGSNQSISIQAPGTPVSQVTLALKR